MSGPVLPPGGQPPTGAPWPGPQGPGPYPPGSWPQPGPPPGPPRGNLRWILLALAFLAVIAVSVAATVWVTHRGPGNQAGSSGSSQRSSGEIASANDTGPVGIITEDPTCDRWLALLSNSSSQLEAWGQRDDSIPVSAWTPEQRQIYESAGRVLRSQIDHTVPLARETPHRVMRELYEQLIAYYRSYADAIPSYKPSDNAFAVVGNNISGALLHICSSITNLSAAKRYSPSSAAAQPTEAARVDDPAEAPWFLTAPSPVCARLRSQNKSDDAKLGEWLKLDNVPAEQWSPTDKLIWENAAQVLAERADQIEEIGKSGGNPVIGDFLALSAQYYRTYASGIPTFSVQDAELYAAAQSIGAVVSAACLAVEG